MARRWIAAIFTLTAIAGCGETADRAGSSGSSSAEPAGETTALPTTAGDPSTPPPSVFPPCDDVPGIEAPAEWYRDGPVYAGNEQPVEQIQAWAESRPSYEDIWLDRDHFGWITVAFSEDAASRQTELAAEFPDVGVVAVEVPSTSAELDALQAQAAQLLVDAGIDVAGAGSYVDRWVVGLDLNASDERVTAALAPLAGERICLSDTGAPAPEGPQPDAGDGWRLLGDELVGEAYRTGIATTEDQYSELWRRARMTADRPPVDFDSEVVVWFGAVYGSTCPIRLDDVIVDSSGERAVVHAVTVVPGGSGVCTDDANPHAYAVAIERDRLPAGPFAIQLGPDDPPVGVPEERTLVDADLSGPAATATADQIGPDRALIDASQQPRPVESGDIVEPGYAMPYRLSTHCGIAVLGQLNGIWWMTGPGDVPVPAPWADAVDPGTETIIVDVLVSPGPSPTATATANGHSVTYSPVSADTVPGCD